ncbi:hypothetical protein CASFOL_020793 [Castilleja foliolosa]|uniref:EngC GTPase domain-containing protein n=1 Tax=Castilleja foliolosa TaxID=1961234 RepID=A0ABD3D1V9_9LAMI
MAFLVKKIVQLSTNQKTAASLHLNYHKTANLRPMAFHSDSRQETGRVLSAYMDIKASVHVKDLGIFCCSRVPKGLSCGDFVTLTSVDTERGTAVVSEVGDKDKLLSVRPKIAHLDQIIVLWKPEDVVGKKGYSLTRFLVQAHSKKVAEVRIALKAAEKEPEVVDRALSRLDSWGYESKVLVTPSPLELREVLEGRTTALFGPPIGKTELLNTILDEKIVEKKGQTSAYILYPFAGGYVGDTPGSWMTELGHIDRAHLASYFPEFDGAGFNRNKENRTERFKYYEKILRDLK